MVWASRGSDLEMIAGTSVVVSGRRTPAGQGVGWIGARPASLIYRGSFQSGGSEAKENEESQEAREGVASNCWLLKDKRARHSHTRTMSQSNTHLALLAVVSALLVLGAAKRAKKPPLLTNLKDPATHAGAGGVTADSEFDIVIVGGGGSFVVPSFLVFS